MTIWKWIGVVYLILSGVFLLGTFFWLVYEDIRLYREPWRKATSKFGYNFKGKGMGWIMLAGCLPGLNLIVLCFFLRVWFYEVTDWLQARRAPARASNK